MGVVAASDAVSSVDASSAELLVELLLEEPREVSSQEDLDRPAQFGR